MPVPHLFADEIGAIKRLYLDENFSALNALGVAVTSAPYFAKGDGITDDTAAIQAALDSGRRTFFPRPPNFYRITAPLQVRQYQFLEGEIGSATIIRNTAGGDVLNFTVAPFQDMVQIKHLRLGALGTGKCIVFNNTYANYIARLAMEEVHTEADANIGIDANLISCYLLNCTDGYYANVAPYVNHRAYNIQFGGAGNANANLLENCDIFNSGVTQTAMSVTSALLLGLVNLRFENNGRDLATSNVQDLLALNLYSERGQHAVSQFEFGASRTGVRIIGAQLNGGLMPAGASMIRAPSASPLVLKEVDSGTTAAAFNYQDSTTSAHFPTALHDLLTDNRWQGNAADPLLPFDNVREGAATAFAPNAVSFTIVPGTGGVTHTGRYSLVKRTVTWQITSTVTGTATIASTAGVSYYDGFPAGLVPIRSAFGCVDDNIVSLGSGLSYINSRHFVPAYAARNANVTQGGVFQF